MDNVPEKLNIVVFRATEKMMMKEAKLKILNIA